MITLLRGLKPPRAGMAATLLVLLLGSCGTPPSAGPTTSHGGPVRDQVSFVDNLRARGLTVDILGVAQQPFLRGSGTRLRLTGGSLETAVEIESYNYDNEQLRSNGSQVAKEDAARIQPDGTPRAASVLWTDPPHFYRSDRVLVLYVGTDQSALHLLTDLLGRQFAGR